MPVTAEAIRDRLADAFSPAHLTVEDVSHTHAGHNPRAAAGGTHFTVTLVAAAFSGQPIVARHRLVYQALGPLMAEIHALAITARSPEEV